MSWADLEEPGLTYAPSPWDTERFGVTVGRVSIGQPTTSTAQVAEALDRSLRSDDRVLVVRYPPSLTEVPAILVASGRTILVADSLVYWGAAQQVVVDRADSLVVSRDDVPTTTRGPVDPTELTEAVTATFQEYPNHYAVNPLFPEELALLGYVEWALRTASDPDRLVVLRQGTQLGGFATWTMDSAGVAEIELAGLVPSARGRGHYALLVAEVARLSLGQGAERLVISTQAGNVGVQRAWSRLGMEPFATFTTLHAVR